MDRTRKEKMRQLKERIVGDSLQRDKDLKKLIKLVRDEAFDWYEDTDRRQT